MKQNYKKHTAELVVALDNMDDFHRQVELVALRMREAFDNDKKVLVAGNGGSATLAQHLSDEMVGKYNRNRSTYPVIALTADSAVLTCIGNDYGYDDIFSRQVEALGQSGDIFISYSTSGNSKNILKAVRTAKKKGVTTVAFTGQKGRLKGMVDIAVVSPATWTARIQELDLHAVHLICEAFEPKK